MDTDKIFILDAKKLIESGNYYDAYREYSTMENKHTEDYIDEYLLYILCLLSNGANIYMPEPSNKPVKNFENDPEGINSYVLDCVYKHDFVAALKQYPYKDRGLLLKQIIEMAKNNLTNNYKRKYNDTFYEYISIIESDFENNDVEALKEDISNYLGLIDRNESIEPIMLLLPSILKYSKIKYIERILDSLTYPHGNIDIDIIKRLYELASEDKDIENMNKLLDCLLLCDPQNKEIYNYIQDDINDVDTAITRKRREFKMRVISEINFSKASMNIIFIHANDSVDEFIILSELDKRSNEVKYNRYDDDFFISPKIYQEKNELFKIKTKADKQYEQGNYSSAIPNYRCWFATQRVYRVNDLEKLCTCFKNCDSTHNVNVLTKLIQDINSIYPENSDTYKESRTNFNYFIPNIDAIIYEIIEQGKSAINVIDKNDLSDEDKVYAYVIIAREYYKKGFDAIGDKLLKLAKKMSDKEDKELHNFITEIELNKKYYKNRIPETFIDVLKLELNKKTDYNL